MNAFHKRNLKRANLGVAGIATLFLILVGIGTATKSHAHGDEIEVGNGSPKGPITLTEAQQKAIGLATATADFYSMADYLTLSGELALLPDRQAVAMPRISGQIKEIYVHLGETVKAGDKLARMQSRQVGDPPPSVDIYAPINGTLDTVNVVLGQSVEPSNELFRISDRSQLNVIAQVYEEDLAKVRVGQKASLHVLSFPDHPYSGEVVLIEPNLNPQTRTVAVWIRVNNAEGQLKPNQFTQANLILKQQAAALAVPNSALLEAAGERFVFIKNGDQFNRVDVVTGMADDQWTEIKEGLVPGDEVVNQGVREIYTRWLTGGKSKTIPGGDED